MRTRELENPNVIPYILHTITAAEVDTAGDLVVAVDLSEPIDLFIIHKLIEKSRLNVLLVQQLSSANLVLAHHWHAIPQLWEAYSFSVDVWSEVDEWCERGAYVLGLRYIPDGGKPLGWVTNLVAPQLDMVHQWFALGCNGC